MVWLGVVWCKRWVCDAARISFIGVYGRRNVLSVRVLLQMWLPLASRYEHSPKVIFLDRADGVDRRHVGLNTKDLEAQTGSLLNHLVGVIGILRRHGIRFPLDVARNVLRKAVSIESDHSLPVLRRGASGIYLSRNENRQRTSQRKDTGRLHGSDDSIDLNSRVRQSPAET